MLDGLRVPGVVGWVTLVETGVMSLQAFKYAHGSVRIIDSRLFGMFFCFIFHKASSRPTGGVGRVKS